MTSDERIARLEAQIEKLQTKQSDLHRQLIQAQRDQWQGRVDDLEVQMHLGAMEANDKAAALMDQLRSRWADARGQFCWRARARSLRDPVMAASRRSPPKGLCPAWSIRHPGHPSWDQGPYRGPSPPC